MKEKSLFKVSMFFIICTFCFLQGCETLKGFSGEDKGAVKMSQGFGQDLNNVWDKVLEIDETLREKFW